MPITFQKLEYYPEDLRLKQLMALMSVPKEFWMFFNSCENENQKNILRDWVVSVGDKVGLDIYCSLFTDMLERDEQQYRIGDVAWWVLEVLDRSRYVREFLLEFDPEEVNGVSVMPKLRELAAEMKKWFKHETLCYKFDRFSTLTPKVKEVATFYKLQHGHPILNGAKSSDYLAKMMIEDPEKFWLIFDHCRNDDERKKLLWWANLPVRNNWLFNLFNNAQKGSALSFLEIQIFVEKSKLSANDNVIYKKRQWGLLFLLEQDAVLMSLLCSYWNNDIGVYRELREIFFSNAHLIHQVFPGLSKEFYKKIFNYHQFTNEEIVNVCRLSQASSRLLTKKEFENALNTQAVFRIYFNNLSYGFELNGNLKTAFFCKQRSDFFAGYLKIYLDLVWSGKMKSYFWSGCGLYQEFPFMAPLLFENPTKFILKYYDLLYSKWKYPYNLSLAVIYIFQHQQYSEQHLSELWNASLGIWRGTIGDAVFGYIQKLLTRDEYPDGFAKEALELYFTLPSLFTRCPINIVNFFVRHADKLPLTVIENFVFHPHFDGTHFGHAKEQVQDPSPFLMRMLLVPNELDNFFALLYKRKDSFGKFFDYLALKSQLPEIEAVRQKAVGFMANDSRCFSRLLVQGSLSVEERTRYFLPLAKKNIAWFQRLFVSTESSKLFFAPISHFDILMADGPDGVLQPAAHQFFDDLKKVFVALLNDEDARWFRKDTSNSFVERLSASSNLPINYSQLVCLLSSIKVDDDAHGNKNLFCESLLRPYVDASLKLEKTMEHIQESLINAVQGNQEFIAWLVPALQKISKEVGCEPNKPNPGKSTFYASVANVVAVADSVKEDWKQYVRLRLSGELVAVDACVISLLKATLEEQQVSMDELRQGLLMAMAKNIDIARQIDKAVERTSMDDEPLISFYQAIFEVLQQVRKLSSSSIRGIEEMRLDNLLNEFKTALHALNKPELVFTAFPR